MFSQTETKCAGRYRASLTLAKKQKSGGQMTQHEGAIDDLFGVVFRPLWTRHGAIAFARVGNAPDGATRIIGN